MHVSSRGWSRDIVPIAGIGVLACVAHGWMLVNPATFWDDWHWRHLTDREVMGHYLRMSRPFYALIYGLTESVTRGETFHRLLTFLSMLCVSAVFYLLLRESRWFSRRDAFLVAAIHVVFPQYFARLCQAMSHYSISLALFSIAVHGVVSGWAYRSWVLRATALGLFFCAFTMNSLIWLYLVPWICVFAHSRSASSRLFPAVAAFTRRNWDFLLLPFVYQAVHVLWFPKSGTYAHYNAIHWHRAHEFASTTWQSFRDGYVELIRTCIRDRHVVALLAIAGACIAWRPGLDRARLLRLAAIGAGAFVLFLFSMLPYSFISQRIDFYNIGDRSSIVALFASALLTFALISLPFVFTKYRAASTGPLLVVLGLLIDLDFQVHLSFLQAAIKQDALIEWIASAPELRSGRTFLFVDRATEYVPKRTPYEHSQLVGLLGAVFRTEERCASQRAGECGGFPEGVLSQDVYGLRAYRPGKEEYRVVIDYGSDPLTVRRTIELIARRWLDPDGYRKNLAGVLTLAASRF